LTRPTGTVAITIDPTIATGATTAARATKVFKAIAAIAVTIATKEIIATISTESRREAYRNAKEPRASRALTYQIVGTFGRRAGEIAETLAPRRQ
jgi:hypothetical protein